MMKSLIQLSLLPNGEWWDDSCVQLWLPYGTEYDHHMLATTVANRVVKVLCPRLFEALSKDTLGLSCKRRIETLAPRAHVDNIMTWFFVL